MSSIRSFALLAGSAIALAGCAVAPVGPAGGRTANPEVLTQWTAKGRIALVAQGQGGSGSFVWQQRSERTELAFRGPLGAGGLGVTSDGDTLQVTDASGQSVDGEAARAALEQRLGTPLPLGELRYWILGVPAPEALGAAQRATGSVPGFTQNGWVVSYEAFRDAGGWSLPNRVTATTGDARVRIVIDDWTLPPAP